MARIVLALVDVNAGPVGRVAEAGLAIADRIVVLSAT